MPKKLSLDWKSDKYVSSSGITVTRAGVVDAEGNAVKSLNNADADALVAEAAALGVSVVEADDPAAVEVPVAATEFPPVAAEVAI